MNPFKYISRIPSALRMIFSFHSGLVPSIVEYKRAMNEANEKHRQTGHRYYCIWNSQARKLITLTFDRYPGRTDSYQYMRRRGVFRPINRNQFKAGAYYYTGSKNGALPMSKEEQKVQREILRKKCYAR